MAAGAWTIWDNKVETRLSLGQLEHIAVDIVCMQGQLHPQLWKPVLLLACADHGSVALLC
ncbi:MAG: nicotinate-nucleotide--dimethylbenzimidazole phosphoribosyltransferase [Spirochaetales bacterium]|nr:nicotinate-nucleotide--dimethylbenzimidazole phosphoribosyltransferase [Spirochaetales bacterium]